MENLNSVTLRTVWTVGCRLILDVEVAAGLCRRWLRLRV